MEHDWEVSRRDVLRFGALGAAGTALGLLRFSARTPIRLAADTPPSLPDIQHDIADFLAPVDTIDGIPFRFGPVFTKFVTAGLSRTPTRDDQRVLADALAAIEGGYRFAADGAFTFVSYGLPYFRLLPEGVAAAYVPQLVDQPRFALEEAIPSPTDLTFGFRRVVKERFNVPVTIESNALLFTIRSDNLSTADDIDAWLRGSNTLAGRKLASPAFKGLIRFNPARVMFTQRGMPRRVADRAGLAYANRIHPDSPMWMGFADQQVAGSGPAAVTTFQGNSSAHLTTAKAGDYFDNASIQHLSHVILDLEQFYLGNQRERPPGLGPRPPIAGGPAGPGGPHTAAGGGAGEQNGGNNDESGPEPFIERVQYMFRSTPPPSTGFADQFTDGGGPTFLPNDFLGPDDAARGAQGIGTPQGRHRLGHLSALQRSSRAADGTAVHIRMDGPGFDALDVPGGATQPKLHFSIFVPTADFFAQMRNNQASVDLARANRVPEDDQGIERFLTATRRQNFLVPPRRHRAFPLTELADQHGLI
jgi:hypothetical protein